MPSSQNSAPTGTVVTHPRPAAIPLDLAWLRETRVNRPAAEGRAATLAARRSIKREWQAAWLLRALSCIDLTTLEGSDTPARVLRLCAKARQPLRAELIAELGLAETPRRRRRLRLPQPHPRRPPGPRREQYPDRRRLRRFPQRADLHPLPPAGNRGIRRGRRCRNRHRHLALPRPHGRLARPLRRGRRFSRALR